MSKYVCIRNYTSLNDNIHFTKNDIIEAEHALVKELVTDML